MREMTPEEVFDTAVKQAQLMSALKPTVDKILEEPYSAALLLLEQNKIIELYKSKFGDISNN